MSQQYNIGDEVVVYAKGRVRTVDEDCNWVTKERTIKYVVDYPDNQGYARVTGKALERADIDT